MSIRDELLKWANDEQARGNPVSIQEIAEHVDRMFRRQASIAKQGMDAAKAAGSHMEANAKRLAAECRPEALESEREANARLTDERDALAAHVGRFKKAALDAIHQLPGGQVKAELRDVYDDVPETSLARLKAQWQAEALEALITKADSEDIIIESCYDDHCGSPTRFDTDISEDVVNWLRRQAEAQPEPD